MNWVGIVCLTLLVAGTSQESAKGNDVDFEQYDFGDFKIDEDDEKLTQAEESLFGPVSYASGDGEEGESQQCGHAGKNTDEYVDKVLDEVRPKLPEPAVLPDRLGRFRLLNGTLLGLPSLHRAGPAMVRCKDSAFMFMVPIELSNLSGAYSWELDTSLRPLRGTLDIGIRSVQADVLYSRRESPSGVNATVKKFTITRLYGVDVNFDGLGPLNRIASRLTNFVSLIFRRGVARMLEGPVRKAINKELENIEKYEQYYY